MAEGFLTQLRRVNTERYFAWTEGADAGIMFDALELGGEVGELLNVVTKLDREQRGWRGARADPADFADECADVLICLDKLARRLDVDLEAVTIAKFNATSDKVGLPHRLAINQAGEVDWTRTKAFDEAVAECMRTAEGSVFADTVSEDERRGYWSACNFMAMSFRVMASRAAPDWPPRAAAIQPPTSQEGEAGCAR
jgi:NTP pyrophosphatase (non-canonical NTP hydrolase)